MRPKFSRVLIFLGGIKNSDFKTDFNYLFPLLITLYLKVRWNACYAAGGVFKPSYIFEEKQLMSKRLLLIETLLPIVENFPNFKVMYLKEVFVFELVRYTIIPQVVRDNVKSNITNFLKIGQD